MIIRVRDFSLLNEDPDFLSFLNFVSQSKYAYFWDVNFSAWFFVTKKNCLMCYILCWNNAQKNKRSTFKEKGLCLFLFINILFAKAFTVAIAFTNSDKILLSIVLFLQFFYLRGQGDYEAFIITLSSAIAWNIVAIKLFFPT